MRNPCYMCENRNATCHSTCEKYKEWRAAQTEINQKIREKILYDNYYRQDYHNARNKNRINKEKSRS